MGSLHFQIQGVLHIVPLLCPFLGNFPTMDKDNHGSVCAVGGVLTPPGEEERIKSYLIQLSGTLS